MNSIRGALIWKNAWRVRSIALGCIVLFVGIGSQVLVNALAANTGVMTLKVTAYAFQGKMADGSWTHLGACAVDRSQFPFGTVIALYNTDGTFNRQCTAEDTSEALGYGDLDLAMPGDVAGASQWGVRYLPAHVLRWGWGNGGMPKHPPSPTSVHPIHNPVSGRFRP